MRAAAHLLILPICGAMSMPALAQEVAISGRAVDSLGNAVGGVELSLVPVLSPFEQAAHELSGVAVPVPVTTRRSGDDGEFQLVAPEPGFWRLIAVASGHAPMEYTFAREPLLGAVTLPALELSPARTIRVDAERPDGEAATEAWIATSVTTVEPVTHRAVLWRPHLPLVRASGGSVSIIVPQGAGIEVQAWQRGHRMSTKTAVTGSSARLRLRPGVVRRLVVKDSAGNALADAILRVGEVRWPLTRTRADGLASLHSGPGEGARATILLADGRSATVRLTANEGRAEPFEVTVPDAILLGGRVLDEETRDPVAEAFVYPFGAVGRHVRTDSRGGFELVASVQKRFTISAAAAGFLPNKAQVDPAAGFLTIAIEASIDLPGLVLGPNGERVPGAEIFARPHGDSMQKLSALFRGPSRRSVSDSGGEFTAPRLKKDLPYSITARLEGYATAEAIVRNLEESAAGGGVVLELTSGTTLTGRVLAPDGRGVAGASLTLERSEASEAMRYMLEDPRSPRPFRFEFSTDAEGEFSFADTPTGEFNLEVQASGFALEVLPVFEIKVGIRTHDLGLIDLEPGVDLAGRVIDPDGLPLAGAKISLESREGVVFSGSSGPELQALSGSTGDFSFSDRRRGEFLDLTVTLPGFAEKKVPRVEVPPESLLEVTLEPAVTLRGRVSGPDGQPLAGVTVMAAREGGGSSYGGRVYSSPEAWNRSDELGRFELADLEPGTVRVSTQAQDWLDTEIGDVELVAGVEPKELEIELRSGATVTGRVVGPNGAPLSEAIVGLQDFQSRATSDGDGNYSLSGVEPGKRVLMAHHEGLQVVQELDVEAGANRLDFFFEAGVEVSGVVVSPAGDPVEGAVLSLSAPGVRSFGAGNSVRSDATGAFRLENVLPGLFQLTAEHPAFGATTLEEPIEVSTGPITGLQVRLAAGVVVIGSIRGAAAEDLVNVEVVAIRQEGGFYEQGRVDSDGGYRIANLAPGAWQVWAQSATGRQVSEHLEIAEGETQVILDLEFKDGLELSGQVLHRGEPLGGAWINASGTDTESGASVQTDHAGRFRLTGLEAGTYTLRVSGFTTGVSHSEEIELLRDDEILIELDGTAISGQITHRRGHEALAGVSVILEAVGPAEDGVSNTVPKGASSDAAGRFRLTDVSPGSYRIRFSKPGYAAQSKLLDIDDDPVDGVDFALEEVEGLSLTVLQPGGAPAGQLAYAVLALTGDVVQSGRETATTDGLIRLATVPDGEWTVLIEASGAAVGTLRTRAPREGATVRLEREAMLSVRVEELVQDATTLATLRLTGANGLPFKSLAWNGGMNDHWRLRAGRAVVSHLPAGRWILSINTTDDRTWERVVSLEAGTNDEVVFD